MPRHIQLDLTSQRALFSLAYESVEGLNSVNGNTACNYHSGREDEGQYFEGTFHRALELLQHLIQELRKHLQHLSVPQLWSS